VRSQRVNWCVDTGSVNNESRSLGTSIERTADQHSSHKRKTRYVQNSHHANAFAMMRSACAMVA
jgi:hypothetical protein